MRRPWYRADPELYEAVREEVESAYPEMWFVERGLDVGLLGWYPLWDGCKVWDRYQIEVVLPKESPRGLPTLYERGGRIPRNSDRHMEADGRACVVLPDAFWYGHRDGMTICEFLGGPVRSFLANQSLIDLGQSNVWSNGEWGHGVNGIRQFYADVLETKDPMLILEYLKVLGRNEVKGHWLCPCGSGKRLRDCHRARVHDLRSRIPPEVARGSLERLQGAEARGLSR